MCGFGPDNKLYSIYVQDEYLGCFCHNYLIVVIYVLETPYESGLRLDNDKMYSDTKFQQF